MTSNGRPSEVSPLLPTTGNESRQNNGDTTENQAQTACESNPRVRGVVWGFLTLLFAAALVLLVGFEGLFGDTLSPWLGGLPKDPALAALAILDKAPVIVCPPTLLCKICETYYYTFRTVTSVRLKEHR